MTINLLDDACMILQEQKTQVRVVDDNSVPSVSVSANPQHTPHDLRDAPTPLQSSGALTDAPVVSSGTKVGFTLQFKLEDLMSKRKKRLSRCKYTSHTSQSIKSQG